jgi:hypothetical protein
MALISSTNRQVATQRSMRPALGLPVLGLATLLLAGCATWQAPEAVTDPPWRARAVSESKQAVRLSAAVLSAEDSRRLFGADVNATGIQPVWVEVENGGEGLLWLLHAGTDPDYFSPLEVAWSFHGLLSKERNQAIDEHFDRLAFPNPVPPGSTRAGVIFTNPHRRTRVLNVDLLGQRRLHPFTLFLTVPDDPPDAQIVQIVAHYAAAEQAELKTPDTLRAALEQLPRIATGVTGTTSGEPVNVVLVGAFADLAAALQRRGYRSDRRQIDGGQRLFGRPPDIVGRKAGLAGAPAHWLRLWVAPLRYRGQLVFLGQAGRPVGGRFAAGDADALEAHPDFDEARNLLIQDLLYSGGLAKLGFVRSDGVAGDTQPAEQFQASHYATDDLRAVMFFTTRPLALSDIELLDWDPYLERRAASAAAEQTP